jgi:hypothetical protein
MGNEPRATDRLESRDLILRGVSVIALLVTAFIALAML